jgi:hypothetical protein
MPKGKETNMLVITLGLSGLLSFLASILPTVGISLK